jgi:hypothetical protein
MHKFTSLSDFQIKNMGTVFTVECPIVVARNRSAMLEQFPEVEINGEVYKPKGFETYCLQCDLRIGEIIGILV